MKIALAMFTALLVLGCVGQGDYDAALEQQRLYNQMVCDGTWPPYQGPADCTKYDAKKFDSAP